MAEKYELGHFGHCPRVYCHGAKVLPVGCSDIPGQETVKLFCPACLDVYSPPNSRFQTVDGAFFGTTFGCLFFMTFPELNVGGNPPSPDASPSASSSVSNTVASSSFDKDTRSSLSSLTSPPQLPPPPLGGNAQPESINGVTPKNLAPGLGPGNLYEPRIYGFRVAEVAKTGPRMKWLRGRPADVNELDECRLYAQNQELAQSQTDLADEEMADGNDEVDAGEMEEDDMGAAAGAVEDEQGSRHRDQHSEQQQDGESAQVREVAQRRKPSRRRNHSLMNGEGGGGGTAVQVGDGG